MRKDKGSIHHSLDSGLTSDVEKEVNSVEKLARLIDKIHKIMNTVKKNGLYSSQELSSDLAKFERFHCPAEEERVLLRAWDTRKKANKVLMIQLEGLCDTVDREVEKYVEK